MRWRYVDQIGCWEQVSTASKGVLHIPQLSPGTFFEMAVACWFGRWNFWEHRHPQNFQRKGIPSWTVGWGSGGIRESPRIIEKTPNGRAPHLFVRRRKLLPISGRKHGVARERNYTWESPNPINCLNLMWRWSEKKGQTYSANDDLILMYYRRKAESTQRKHSGWLSVSTALINQAPVDFLRGIYMHPWEVEKSGISQEMNLQTISV